MRGSAHWAVKIVLPMLADFTRIPCLSPAFEPGWEADGHLAAAARLLADWRSRRPVPGLTAEVVSPPGRTPVVLVEVPPTGFPILAGTGAGRDRPGLRAPG